MSIVSEADKVWTFINVSFARAVDSDKYTRIPVYQAVQSIDHIFNTVSAYRDSGGYIVQPIQLAATFNTYAEAQALLNKIGSTGTLTGPKYSGIRMLTEAELVHHDMYVTVNCTFA
jgi:hypothetical protein